MAGLTRNPYQAFFVEIHPTIKSEHPSWTPQEITTEIGRRWSLETMTIVPYKQDLCVRHGKETIVLDAVGQQTALKTYLDSYRIKHGNETTLKLIYSIANTN